MHQTSPFSFFITVRSYLLFLGTGLRHGYCPYLSGTSRNAQIQVRNLHVL